MTRDRQTAPLMAKLGINEEVLRAAVEDGAAE
jgi:hypothetical protein